MKLKKDKKKYHILLLIRWPIGGIRAFINYNYNNFDEDRYNIYIICPNYPETNALLKDLRKFNISYLPLGPNFNGINFLKSLIRTIFSQKIDIIHSHGLTAGVYSAVVSRIFRIPNILTLHETLYKDQFNGMLGSIKLKILSFLLARLDVIHLVSKDAETNFLQYFPHLKHGRTKLIPILNGIEISRYQGMRKRDLRAELNLSEDSFLIGFLGRFMPVKGIKYLIEALEYILKNFSHLRKKPILLTFGWGGFIREEMKIVKEKGIDKSVISLPFVKNTAETLRGLDVVVMPSLSEACGLLAMEAMVVGVPVIGSNCIGLREVLSHTPSVMVPPEDSLALAKALIKEIRYPSKPKAKAFRKEAEPRFNVKKQSAKLEKVMLEMINSKRP